jgi:hypothetical protein
LGEVLRDAAASGEAISVEAGEELFELDVLPVPRAFIETDEESDAILGIIGILDEGEPTDIARFKDRYIADAIERRSE